MDSNGIRAQILMLRKRRGLTQAELGEKLGVSAKTVSKWETGRSYPDILLLPRLAAVFGVTVDALFAESANPLEAAPNALPYSSSPHKKTSSFLGSFAFAISTLSMLLPWTLLFCIAPIYPVIFHTAVPFPQGLNLLAVNFHGSTILIPRKLPNNPPHPATYAIGDVFPNPYALAIPGLALPD